MKTALNLNEFDNKNDILTDDFPLPRHSTGRMNKDLVGNKAFNLSYLSKNCIEVAKFFVISTSVYEKFATKKIPIKLQKEILLNFNKLNAKKVAVRSSANCEDGVNSSFAGQFESFLSVDKNHLLENIKRCWATVSSEQVLSYCKFHKIDPSLIKMAVIVQKMVRADKGGVIFTKDVFNNTNRIVIEAAQGLGENIVSGTINPHRIFIPRDRKSDFSKLDGDVLNGKEIKKLFNLGLKIENVYKIPQDIEWAIEKNKIYILQTRPITY